MTAATASLTEGKAVSVMKGKLPIVDTTTTSVPISTTINNATNNNTTTTSTNNLGTSFIPSQIPQGPTPFDRAILVLLNNSEEIVQAAVSILSKIISNIIAHPNDEKYRKINKNNVAFSKKVGTIQGGEGCLIALGFQMQGEEWVLIPNANAWDNLVNCQGKLTRFCDRLANALKSGPIISHVPAPTHVINSDSDYKSNSNTSTSNTTNPTTASTNDIIAMQQFLTALQQTTQEQNKTNHEDSDNKDKF